MPTSTMGEDIESALEVIESNGGVGSWETDTSTDIPRWLFPRYPGAEKHGTCKIKSHEGVHDRTAKCKGFEADPGGMYLSRSGIGPHDTDVETLVAWLEAPRSIVGAIMLLGEPGCGKTALIEAAITHADRKMVTVLCTPDHTKDSLFMKFVGEGNGDPGRNGKPTPFTLGPLAYAALHGYTLYMDEVMLLIDGVKPVLYALGDGRDSLPEGHIDGSPLKIHPDFRLVMSSNPAVRGASLPEPLSSRCASTTITVETSEAMLIDLGIDESVIAAWKTLGTAGLWRPQIRELRLASYWLPIDRVQAVSAFLPEHAPESMRERIRDSVVSYLGGSIGPSGRLVVS